MSKLVPFSFLMPEEDYEIFESLKSIINADCDADVVIDAVKFHYEKLTTKGSKNDGEQQ